MGKLTRSEVASILEVSISTVRRMEGQQLQPEISDNGVRLFEQTHIEAFAATYTRGRGGRRVQGQDRSPGEIAAEVFERFERRESLSEIVRALTLTPKKVRTLYREWRTSLELGEYLRDPSIEPRDWNRHKTADLDYALARLPADTPIQIGVARQESHGIDEQITTFDELGTFTTSAPVTLTEIHQRYGGGVLRLSAYSLAEKRLLWEVYGEIVEVA